MLSRTSSRARIRELEAELARLRGREDLSYLVVLTYGRSGSTLLQGILNAIPGYLIRGENGQNLASLRDFHTTAVHHRRRQHRWLGRHPEYDTLPVSNPWFGIDQYPHGRLWRDLRRLFVDNVLGPAPDTRVAGFKEIRWDREDLPEFVGWIRDLLPGVRFILNTRDLDDVARSGWWRDQPGSRERLDRFERRLLDLVDTLGEHAYRVHYDEYVADPGVLRGLFDWLGEEFDEYAVRALMDRPHSYLTENHTG